jgi:hypothetical protein
MTRRDGGGQWMLICEQPDPDRHNHIPAHVFATEWHATLDDCLKAWEDAAIFAGGAE